MTTPPSTLSPTLPRDALAKPAGKYELQSLDRAVAVLEFLGRSDRPLTLAEICQSMDIHKSTAHRSLMVLERNALIERTQENRFRLGLKLYSLGRRAVEQLDLRAHVQPYFRRLSTALGETVHMGILQKASVVYVDKWTLNQKVCLNSMTGNSKPAYSTAMGKALLAFQPLETVEWVIANSRYVRYTQKTICSREAFSSALETVRECGYAIDDEEGELGVRCVGVPIFNENRRAVAAASVSGPVSRITMESVASVAEQLLSCSREISMSLRASTE